MAGPIPTPLPPWAKVLIQVVPFIVAGLQAAVDYIGEIHPTDSSTPGEWRRFVYSCHDPTDPDNADVVMTTFDIVNMTNGQVDNSWTQADYDTVTLHLEAILTAWKVWQPTSVTWFEGKAYRMQFTPRPPVGTLPSQDKPFAVSGPPVWTKPLAIVGSGTGTRIPSQCACTTTELTPYRKHWGRNYWPFPSSNTVASDGHIASTVLTSFRAEVQNRYAALATAQLHPVVPVRQIGGLPDRALLGVTNIQMDNVFDVQRRRRMKNATQIVLNVGDEIITKAHSSIEPGTGAE